MKYLLVASGIQLPKFWSPQEFDRKIFVHRKDLITVCNHNPTSQKRCQKKNIQNWINIYGFPFTSMEIMLSNFFPFISMLRNSNQKSIWWNFYYKFWFRTSWSEHLWHKIRVNFAKDYQKDSYNKTHLMGKF